MAESGELKNSLRQKAEQELSKRQSEISLPAEKEDNIRLVHELLVHQIELEIRNAELLRIQQELQESNERYRYLYDYAPVGYFTINSDFKISNVNLDGAELLKEPRSKLHNMPFPRFIAPEETDRFYLYFKKVFSTNHQPLLELKMQKADKTAFYARLESARAENAELRLALTDITETEAGRRGIGKSQGRIGGKGKGKGKNSFLRKSLRKS